MKAFLLVAGLGTRLRPVTNNTPKCLVPIGNRPLMAYWFDLLEKYNVSEVLINLHHLPEKVRDFVDNYPTSLKVRMFYEEQLLGSGGTVWANREWVQNDSFFLIAYGDNLTNANLKSLIDFHCKNNPVLTMAVFKTDNPRECGIATIDEDNTIIGFEEKPTNPISNLANAGLFVASQEIFDYFPENNNGVLDFGFDILPKLIGKMKAYLLTEYLQDIGTLARYQKANEDIKNLIF